MPDRSEQHVPPQDVILSESGLRAGRAEGSRESETVRTLKPDEMKSYQKWKQEIPSSLRSLVEGHIQGKTVRVDKSDLPSVVEFYTGMQKLLNDPHTAVEEIGVSEVVQKQLFALLNMNVGEEHVNILAALADPEISFEVKTNYVQSKLLPRLQFLRERDRRVLEKAQNVTGEHEQEEEYSPHRAPEQETEGELTEAIATVAPFYGGNFVDSVFDLYDPETLTWKKSPRKRQEVPEQRIDKDRKRTYRSVVKNGKCAVKLPHGWGVDKSSTKISDDESARFRIEHDQDGIIRLNSEIDGPLSINIAPTQDFIDLSSPEGEVPEVPDQFPLELLEQAQALMATSSHPERSEGSPFNGKLRRIASIIHKHLEYDKDPKWEVVYKADPLRYFEKIWENKKAKCDEANTMLARLLTKLGVHARFIGGHSVRTKSPTGEAMLLDSNRHARAFAWDPEHQTWIRLDATPAGDPNVDEEEQKQDLEEGDYGDKEAELMSEEELEKQLEKIEKEEHDREEREDPILKYAKEGDCSPEEARTILDKITTLRERYARVLLDADKQWQTLVRQNVREQIVDRGPVPLSQMDEIDEDEIVSGYIEIKSGEKDPLIGQREVVEQKKEKWFGGYEVYINADMSESMSWTINGVKKVDAQRDMAFLLVDSCMNASVTTRKKEHQLKAPMPVKVSVVVIGERTEIVLPLTEEWGPKEQIKLYRALDAGAGGTTPDHDGLSLIEQQIIASKWEQDQAREKQPKLKDHGWKPQRFVIATADGGSDSPRAVKLANERLKTMGVPVDLFLIADEEDENLETLAKKSYQSVTPISDVSELAEKGLKRLMERIKEAYGK